MRSTCLVNRGLIPAGLRTRAFLAALAPLAGPWRRLPRAARVGLHRGCWRQYLSWHGTLARVHHTHARVHPLTCTPTHTYMSPYSFAPPPFFDSDVLARIAPSHSSPPGRGCTNCMLIYIHTPTGRRCLSSRPALTANQKPALTSSTPGCLSQVSSPPGDHRHKN